MRSAKLKMRASCVTMISARLFAERRSRAATPSPCARSRDPSELVGSSQTISSRLVHERPGDGNALLLSAGKLSGERFGAVLQPTSRQQVALARQTACAARMPFDQQRNRNILGGGQRSGAG